MRNSRQESLGVRVMRGEGDGADSSLNSLLAPASPHLSSRLSGHDEKEDAGIILSTCHILWVNEIFLGNLQEARILIFTFSQGKFEPISPDLKVQDINSL